MFKLSLAVHGQMAHYCSLYTKILRFSTLVMVLFYLCFQDLLLSSYIPLLVIFSCTIIFRSMRHYVVNIWWQNTTLIELGFWQCQLYRCLQMNDREEKGILFPYKFQSPPPPPPSLLFSFRLFCFPSQAVLDATTLLSFITTISSSMRPSFKKGWRSKQKKIRALKSNGEMKGVNIAMHLFSHNAIRTMRLIVWHIREII